MSIPAKNTVRRKGFRGKTPSGKPNPIDIHVGSRIRLRRTLLGITQEKLGELLGLTFQQVQKYERGTNRCGASRLFDLARVLDVPVGFFFDGMDEGVAANSPAQILGSPTADQAIETIRDPALKRETLELVRTYYRITDVGVRRRVYDLAKALADTLCAPASQAAE